MSNYYCLNCGSLVPDGMKVCPVCGEPVIGHTLQTPAPVFPPEPDEGKTIAYQPVSESADTAQLMTSKDNAKTIPVKKPVVEATKEEKKPNFFSRIFFEEVEIDDEEEAKKNDEGEEKKHSHVLPVILVIILAILLGSAGYLYLEKPALLNSGLQKIGLSLPGYTKAEASPAAASASASASSSATAAATASAAPASLGTVTVELESINIRDAASTSGNALGKATQGTTYTVLATSSGEGYTWYEIGEGKWIADSNGEWVTYTK